MNRFFFSTLDRSLSASWIVLAVILCRLVLKKAPRSLLCSLWALVALRLLCPFTLESALSLVPRQTAVTETTQELMDDYIGPTHTYFDIAPEYEMAVEAGIPTVPAGEAGHTYVVTGETPTAPPKTLSDLLPGIWLAGIAVLLLHAAISYLRILRRVQASISLGNGVYLCDYIATPFILGLIRPRIYLPTAIHPADATHVLAHERAHLKRKDHWWKPLGYLLLTIHWFNPLLWLAYSLLCRDIELACDERVIRDLKAPEKQAYSEALLKCSVNRRMLAACPLAFGEVGVKHRIQSILRYKKPSFRILLLTAAATAAIAICFLTDKPEGQIDSPFEDSLWVTELIYSADSEPLYNAPANILDTLDLSLNNNSFTTFSSNFLETQLEQSNFDNLFDPLGQWHTLSPKKLRQQNKNAWILHDNAVYSTNENFHRFYYLLQQKNGDIYLTQGIWWDAQLRPGKTTIEWVFKLEKAEHSTPFEDGDTPYPYTRSVSAHYFETIGWMPLTYPHIASPANYPEDGHAFITDVISMLHSIPEESFSLGSPIENVEVSLTLDMADTDIFDVELRYGEDTVEMVFHEETTWNFAKTGNQVWQINHQGLKNYFAHYSPRFILPEYLQQPLDIHSWREQIKTSDIRSVAVCILTSQQYNYGYHMGTGQVTNLLEQLKKLPDSAFLPTDFDLNVFEAEDAGCIQINWDQGVFADAEDGTYAEIVWINERLYFFIRQREEGKLVQAWEIQNTDFLNWQTSFYDPTIRHGFHTTENPTGTISVSHGNASIQLNTYSYMNYEVIEYTDNQTPFGIRMQPKITKDGWISVLYYPGGFTPDPEWSYSSSGSSNNYNVEWYYLETEADRTADTATARLYTDLAGDYVVINNGLQLWAKEFYFDSSELFSNMLLAEGLPTKEDIMEIVRPLLPFRGDNLNYIRLDENDFWREVEIAFDDRSGFWTVSAAATETQEAIPLLILDIHGNVVQQLWFPG